MPIERLTIFGAGGHAKVVMDAFLAAGGSPGAITLLDGDPALHGTMIMGATVAPLRIDSSLAGAACHVAIGNAGIRRGLAQEIVSAGGHLATIIHPRASVSRYARVEAGSFVAAGAIVGPYAMIGEAVIANHLAVVDHDCTVGAFSHIAPGAVLGGGVTIGEDALIGAGATVLPGLGVGSAAVVGAGAIVTRPVGKGEKVIIVPASKIV